MTLPAQSAAGLDSLPIRVGMFGKRDIKLLRFQALAGDWTFVMQPAPPRNASGPLLSQEIQYVLAEGEDASLEVTREGMMFRPSRSEENPARFAHVEISGDGLLNLEIPYLRQMSFQGTLEVVLNEKTMRVKNTLPLGKYVSSAVSVNFATPEPESLKAQVVAVRTLAAFALLSGRHSSDTYDICDSQHCIPYSGSGEDRELAELMTSRSKDEVMTWDGRLFYPHITQTCGGKTSNARDIFAVDDPIHLSREDKSDPKGQENCYHSPSFEWSREFSTNEMADFIALEFAAGADLFYTGWQVTATDTTGRATRVMLYGRRDRLLTGMEFMRAMQGFFGMNALRSLMFNTILMKKSIIFKGRGEGHGVGMCHWGADGLAKKGWDYRKILNFFFTGISIVAGTSNLQTWTPQMRSVRALAGPPEPSSALVQPRKKGTAGTNRPLRKPKGGK